MYSIEELIKIILVESEKLEDEIRLSLDLKEITKKQLNYVELIQEMKNPTLSELASQLKITKPTTSVMVDKLEEHGYLNKVKSDSDRRSAHVHLTQKGTKAAQINMVVNKRFSQLLIENLTDSEKSILHVILNKAVQSIKK